MIEQQKLVKKLHLDKGLTIAEISDMLEENEAKIKDILEKIPEYNISTSAGDYTFRQLTDEDYVQLRKKSLPIEPMYMFSLEMDRYLEQYGIEGIPEIYAMLSYFFGESSEVYDKYKSSFKYPFLLKVYPGNSQELAARYIVSVRDVKGGMQIEFYKIARDRDKDDYRIYHDPFPELSRKEMERIWFWFMAFVKNGMEYLKENDLAIKPFCRMLKYRKIIYGYKDEEFFAKECRENINGRDARETLQKAYEILKKQAAEEREEINYRNKSSEFIYEIIEETNENSLPPYEFKNLKSELFKTTYNYFSSFDFLDMDRTKEITDSFVSLLIHYLAFKDKYASKKEHFNDYKRIFGVANYEDHFGIEDFKKLLKAIKSDLEEAGYSDNEVQSIIELYKENYREGKKSGRIEVIESLLAQKFDSFPENYTKKLKEKSEDELEDIAIKIFDMEDIEDFEDYI